MPTNENKEKIKTYVNDLRAMAKDAYKLCKAEDGDRCKDCNDLLDCMNGLRNSIGDLAESLAWSLEQISILDDTMAISIEGTKDFMKTTGILVEKSNKKGKKKKKSEILYEVMGFYT